MTANSPMMAVGATQTLSAIARDQNGQPMAATFTWSVNDPAKADVTTSGLVTAKATGSLVVKASANGKEGSVNLRLLTPGAPQFRHTAESVQAGGSTTRFWQYLPQAHGQDPAQRFPVLIYLHSGWDRGTDLNLVLRDGPPHHIDQGNAMTFTVGGVSQSFIVLSPQSAGAWSDAPIQAMLDRALTTLQGDSTRVYLIGASLGGGGTWAFAGHGAASGPKPAERLAAIVPIAGTEPPSAAGAANIAAAGLPVWAFHGDADTSAPYSNSTGWVNAINAANPAVPAQLTTITGGIHEIWAPIFDPAHDIAPGKSMYQWLLEHHR